MEPYDESSIVNRVYPIIKEITFKRPGAILVGVSKTVGINEIIRTFEVTGLRHFGESRVQKLLQKVDELNIINNERIKNRGNSIDSIVWHFIGPLQKNKIKKLISIPNLSFIHSISSLDLLTSLYKETSKLNNERENAPYTHSEISFFLEVKTSNENEKLGLSDLQTIKVCCEFIKEQPPLEKLSLKMAGLMTIGEIRNNNFLDSAKKSFEQLREYRDRIQHLFKYSLKLSMGMSQDYQIALEEESDFIRIGSSIFPPTN